MQGTIVVPVLNEGPVIRAAMERLLATLGADWKLVLVDGGSRDQTLQQVQDLPLTLVTCPPGRARQMNCGAALAEGELILFLHADTHLPENINELLMAFATGPGQWGRFDVELDNPHWPFTMIAWFINQRSALTRVCTGDQALFMRRAFFQQIGGFADIPLMEDIEFSLRARRQATPLRVRTPVRTSARRWSRHGVVKTILTMWWLRLAYRLGVSPQRLHSWYYG